MGGDGDGVAVRVQGEKFDVIVLPSVFGDGLAGVVCFHGKAATVSRFAQESGGIAGLRRAFLRVHEIGIAKKMGGSTLGNSRQSVAQAAVKIRPPRRPKTSLQTAPAFTSSASANLDRRLGLPTTPPARRHRRFPPVAASGKVAVQQRTPQLRFSPWVGDDFIED